MRLCCDLGRHGGTFGGSFMVQLELLLRRWAKKELVGCGVLRKASPPECGFGLVAPIPLWLVRFSLAWSQTPPV